MVTQVLYKSILMQEMNAFSADICAASGQPLDLLLLLDSSGSAALQSSGRWNEAIQVFTDLIRFLGTTDDGQGAKISFALFAFVCIFQPKGHEI